ncbi:MAG: hypothetical protein H7339_14945 [Arcicella sp.]|nr:hypothetical protein [Arcicella sp.]
MKNKILPETQKLIELFNSMRADIQIEFRKHIIDTGPLNDWDIKVDKLEWDIEVDKLEWDIEVDKLEWDLKEDF